jgi:CBS domain-containing protein
MKRQKAKDIMNQDVLSVREDWSIDRLADFFIEHSISGAPVISKKEKLIGVVSLTDIVRYRSIPLKDSQSNTPHEYYIYTPERQYSQEEIESFRLEAESLVTIHDIMTSVVFNVSEDTDLKQVADAMIRGHIHRVFVTRDNALVGIISSLDMLKIIRDE